MEKTSRFPSGDHAGESGPLVTWGRYISRK